MILAGDIGGTKTILGLFSCNEGRVDLVDQKTFPSADYSDFSDVIDIFLKKGSNSIREACFGVAGPVLNQRCAATNLPWIVDADQIGRRFEIATVSLLNDLEVCAYGTLGLSEVEYATLNQGDEQLDGNRAVIAAGTGLGEAVLYGSGGQYFPSPSEAGHADFAPRNGIEIALLEHLLKRYSRVSYERVLSGPGLSNIYRFFKAHAHGKEPRWLSERLENEDAGRVITEAALAGESETCVKALDLFVSIYGAEAGNLALRSLATGGIYIGGGIAPKILKKLQDGVFMKAFLNKGRFGSLLERMPVRVILDPKAALYGAARYASNDR